MLSYLTDATAIWAVSLLTYALCFRKTTFHSLNRAVLLSTLFAGLLLPLWPQEVVQTVAQIPVYIQAPVARISTVKTIAIAEVTANVKPAFSVSLWTVYYAGCVVALLLYVHGASRLFRLTRGAKKCQFSGKSFYETGRPHTPFSLFGRTFLSDASRYSPADLNLILQHEARHGSLKHSLDVVLLALMRIGLWFHPFIYLYDYFLKRVHEYQADAFARGQAQPYGYLLLQEATSNAFPLVHSFHRSPLKSRIVMLTKNASPALLKLPYLLLLPVLFLTVEACKKKEAPTISAGTQIDDTAFSFRGNDFVRQEGSKTTILPNGVEFYRISPPYKMNGERIYDEKEVDVPATYAGSFKSPLHELADRIMPELKDLPDGEYALIASGQQVISKEGRLEYYQQIYLGTGFTRFEDGDFPKEVTSSLQKIKTLAESAKRPVLTAANRAMERGFSFKPALREGKPVNSLIEFMLYEAASPLLVVVKNGNVVIREDGTQTSQKAGKEIASADPAYFKNWKEAIQAAEKKANQSSQQYLQEAGRSEVEANATIAKAKAAAAMIERKEAEIKRAEAVAAHWEALAKRIEAERSAKL